MSERAKMPDEIIAWPSDVTPAGGMAQTGQWSARRHYTDAAVRYVAQEADSLDAAIKRLGDSHPGFGWEVGANEPSGFSAVVWRRNTQSAQERQLGLKICSGATPAAALNGAIDKLDAMRGASR